jgi:protein dithiol:quinone oxidoreductase
MKPALPPTARTGLATKLLVLVVAVVVLSMAGALYFQYVLQLEPCPLCVLQRVAIITTALFAGVGLLASGALGQFISSAMASVFALIGAGIAGWHSWIVRFPPESMTCGRPFQWFHEEFPLGTWLPKLFAGQGDCLKIEWSLFGLSIPDLSLIAFVLLVSLAVLAARATWGRWR